MCISQMCFIYSNISLSIYVSYSLDWLVAPLRETEQGPGFPGVPMVVGSLLR